MASDRIGKTTAEQIAIPPTTWYTKKASWLLEQEVVKNNIGNVPLNEDLLESILKFKMINPILVMPSWYPIVGSQRLRVFYELQKENPNHRHLQQEIRVARFDKEYWNVFQLWPEEQFRAKASAVWFQMVELAWKSIHYIETEDYSGVSMTHFEDVGDKIDWNISQETKDYYNNAE